MPPCLYQLQQQHLLLLEEQNATARYSIHHLNLFSKNICCNYTVNMPCCDIGMKPGITVSVRTSYYISHIMTTGSTNAWNQSSTVSQAYIGCLHSLLQLNISNAYGSVRHLSKVMSLHSHMYSIWHTFIIAHCMNILSPWVHVVPPVLHQHF